MEVESMADGKPRDPRTIRYPPALRERAVEMFYAVVAETGERHGTIQRVAAALGIATSAVRHWVRDADLAAGRRQPLASGTAPQRGGRGAYSATDRRIRELERENRELRLANEILKSASAFFTAELDRHSDS
jgi:transposase